MKTLTSLAVILLIALLFARCAKEEVVDRPFEKVQFLLASPEDNVAGTNSFSSGIPPESFVLVSMERANGEQIFTDHRIKILSTEIGYCTEPIDLQPGRYIITDFLIVSSMSDDLYAAPNEGSAEADYIEQALPYSISVEKEMTTSIAMKVVRCNRHYSLNSRLKEFVRNNRNYKLFYNHKGAVDSIVANEGIPVHYTYRVTYTNGRIDSVGLYDHGQYISAHDDFKYDHKGRIISFNYYFRSDDAPPYPLQSYTVTYDTNGRITTIGNYSYVYNDHSNVIRFNNGTDTYTYDNGKNPFHPIDNLFAVVIEESDFWGLPLSRNNMASVTDVNGHTTSFNNAYDYRNRLVSSNGMLFYYY